MELNLDTSVLPLPKEANFNATIGMLLRTNKSIHVLKTEIFVKVKNRVKIILPLIKSDFRLERKVSI